MTGEPGGPGGAQIRDSNSPALAARMRQLGLAPHVLDIAPDKPEELRAGVNRGLESDVLLVSGGVSMGRYDLIPEVLRDCGVELLFQNVAIKPGKPTVFGRHAGGYVFGLPGNPVSTLVVAELFVVPALKTMMGVEDPMPRHAQAVLDGELQ